MDKEFYRFALFTVTACALLFGAFLVVVITLL